MVQVVGSNSTFDGTIVNYTDFDAYGNAITQSGGSINPDGMSNGGVSTDISTSFAFGAGYWDASNLTYLVHRYLDNESGQFISVDPLVDQTREAYVYAGDGPVMATDVLGLSGCSWHPSSWGHCVADGAKKTWHFVDTAVNEVGDFVSEHKRGLMQIGIGIATVVGVAFCAICESVLGAMVVGGLSSAATYAADCVGHRGEKRCTGPGFAEAAATGAVTGAIGKYFNKVCADVAKCTNIKFIESGLNIAAGAVGGTFDLLVKGEVKHVKVGLGEFAGVGLQSLSGVTLAKHNDSAWRSGFTSLLKTASSLVK